MTLQIFLDWSLATAHNACYSIHPSQNFTDFPANVDDNDLQDNQPINARPLDQHTDTSFTICRLKFVALYRELVDVSLASDLISDCLTEIDHLTAFIASYHAFLTILHLHTRNGYQDSQSSGFVTAIFPRCDSTGGTHQRQQGYGVPSYTTYRRNALIAFTPTLSIKRL